MLSKKSILILVTLSLLTLVIFGCTQESKPVLIGQYEKYFDENSSSFTKVNLASFQEAINNLDVDSNIQLIGLTQEYVDSKKDANFIVGSAYCGNKGLTFGGYALKVTRLAQNSIDLSSIDEIKKYFLPINNSKKAVAYLLLDLDNVDYNSIFVLNIGTDYLVKTTITSSACYCGEVHSSELWFVVGQDGTVQLVKTNALPESYQGVCIS